MPLDKLREFLDGQRLKYVIISHSPAYTAAGIAALTHIPGKELAKTVIVKIDGTLAMAVVSASQHVDLALLKAATFAKTVELAAEDEFKESFPGCEPGAMPPFGNLYGMPVFADESLSRDKEIAFNAGSHRELVRIAWADFERLVKPRVIHLAYSRRAGEAA
ncbi:MAG TPA: YbaK/EbsC family protein [Candidatus Limnocylindrales bacterium]|nr:YbaK/EbsC family protein [Candidatus Limnocylindrales bacterium]